MFADSPQAFFQLCISDGEAYPDVVFPGRAEGIARRWPIEGSGGWILELKASGYGGPMTVIASFGADGALMVAKLMDNDETVGFGKKAEEPGYMEIFAGKGGNSPMPVTKTQLGGDADVVSGATVTFTGISEALRSGSDAVKRWEGR